jgi:Stress up-regulated Nod 19
MKRFIIVLLLALAMGSLTAVTAAPTAQADTTREVLYGPFTIPAGTMENPGMVHNKLLFAVKRPCSDCYITSMTPDLVYADRTTRATLPTVMLHHAMWASQWHRDATCGNTLLGLAGQRFFASGDERTVVQFPAGYGYRVRWYDSWNLLVDLMNHSASDQTVYVKVTFTTRPSSDSVKPLTPVWLDIDQCGDSEYSIPAGFSDTHRDWTVNVPGDLVFMGGHVHGHGIAVEATNESKGGQTLCRSEATLDPSNVHSVLAMSTCSGTPLGVLRAGDVVRLHSEYQSSHAADDVMGIMLGYIHRR